MIIRTPTGNAEVRDMFTGSSAIPAPSMNGLLTGWGSSARTVSAGDAIGIPATLAAIRLLAEVIGSLPMVVYEGNGDERERALNVPQWELLHIRPNSETTPLGLWSYVTASLQTNGGGYLLKTKSRRKVQELYPINPAFIMPKRENGELVFKFQPPSEPSKAKTLTREDIVYIPGILLGDALIGVSPIAVQRQALGITVAQEDFQGSFYANGAAPRGVITHPGQPTTDQRRDMREGWDFQHKGPSNAGKVGLLWGGATYQPIQMTMSDAQFIESQRFSIEQIARIFRVPARLLGITDSSETRITPEQHGMEFLTYSLLPWLIRLEQALYLDDDLFPDKSLFPEFLTDGLLRADTASRYAAYVQARQAGWLSANEIRRMENLPPVPGGDEVQATPVGGAPNPGSTDPVEPTPNPDPPAA